MSEITNRMKSDTKLREVNKFKTPPEILDISKTPHIKNRVLDIEITISEYNLFLKKIKSKSAPGTDNICNEMILNLPEIAHKQILKVINKILTEGIYPEEWRNYLIVLIPRPQAKGFRPISLAQNILKFF